MPELDFKEAVMAKLASEVIENLPQEERDKVLTDLLSKSLNGWEVHNAVEDAITQIAKKDMVEYISRPEVRERIRLLATQTAESFIDALPATLADILVRSMTGKHHYDSKDTDFTRALQKYFKIDPDK